MGVRDWDIVTSYVDSVTTSLKTVTFPKVQEQVKLKNQGNANITYTIGSQSGTLTPGQSITVNEDISSFTIQAASGTQAFELRAKEKGTEQTETDLVESMNRVKGSNFPTKTLDKLAAYDFTKIVCFGDSLTWGAKANFSGVRVATPYPAALQSWLNYYHGHTKTTVVNSGNPGYRADQCVSLVDTQVLANNPDCVVIMLGANEGIQGGPSYSLFRDSMVQIIEKCLTANVEVVLMTTHQITIGYWKYLAHINSITRALADEYKLALVDWEKESDKYYANNLLNPYDLMPDGVHFADDKSYKLIADAIMVKYLFPRVFTLKDKNKVAVVNNANVTSDCAILNNPTTKLFKKTYSMKAIGATATGTKLTFSIYHNGDKTSKYFLIGNNSPTGAKVTYKINGNTVDTLNFYNDIALEDAEFPLALTPGLNEIEFNVANTYVGDGSGYDLQISGIGVKEYSPLMSKKYPALQNSWALNDSLKPVFYQRSASNEIVFSKVYISAYAGGIKTNGTVLFTIADKEDRPTQDVSFTVPTEQGVANTCTITFGTDGTCKLYGYQGNNWLLLDNVRFVV